MGLHEKSFGKHGLRALSGALADLGLCGVIAASSALAQEIAITVDDLPAHGVLPQGQSRMQIAKAFVDAFHAAGVPPTYGFVNGVRVHENPADAQVLDAWRAAGNPLGNHTWSHINLNEHFPADFEADVLRNEPVISDRMGGEDWRWLRFHLSRKATHPTR